MRDDKRRKMDQHRPIEPHPTPSTPTLNLQLPQSCTTMPSFLNENLQAYITSPSPRSSKNTPTLNNIDLEALISNQESNESMDMATDTADDTTESLKNCLLAAKEHGTKTNNNATFTRDPMEKYTRQLKKKLEVHYSHLTAMFDNIDIDQVLSWESLPGGKLLAHPFSHEVEDLEAHPEIKKKVFAVIAKITQSSIVGFFAPKPGLTWNTPLVFFIYNLTEPQKQTLLNRSIWSSKATTFCVITLEPVRPNFLFSITDLTTKNLEEVKEAIH
jgi:hypothetical protein